MSFGIDPAGGYTTAVANSLRDLADYCEANLQHFITENPTWRPDDARLWGLRSMREILGCSSLRITAVKEYLVEEQSASMLEEIDVFMRQEQTVLITFTFACAEAWLRSIARAVLPEQDDYRKNFGELRNPVLEKLSLAASSRKGFSTVLEALCNIRNTMHLNGVHLPQAKKRKGETRRSTVTSQNFTYKDSHPGFFDLILEDEKPVRLEFNETDLLLGEVCALFVESLKTEPLCSLAVVEAP